VDHTTRRATTPQRQRLAAVLADRNTRWHVIHDVPTAQNVTPLLEVIDDPGRPPFLG
jgi:hypothetical protein